MYWPTPQDYNEAVQNPDYAFADEELISGSPELTPIGLPKPVTGNFASVYRFQIDRKLVAVKCFLRYVPDQMQRYEQLSNFMCGQSTPYIVDFQYQSQGIRIKTDWYPILKMDWVEGLMLDQYLRKYVGNKVNVQRLADQFSKMAVQLQQLGIAHGDLQHGNMIVQPADLRLVDYDGMFVPSLAGSTANELGHPNYQHPQRSEQNFNAAMDDFSAWLIHSSLIILTIDPLLFKNYNGGDECILFRQPDLCDPTRSRLFKELTAHAHPAVRSRGQFLVILCQCPISQIPRFSEQIPDIDSIPIEVKTTESNAGKKKSPLPDWMLPDEEADALFEIKPSPAHAPAQRPVPSHLKQAPRLPSAIKWPTVEQYEKAVVKPATSFKDIELAESNPLVKLKICGRHGIVYQISAKNKTFAVKCFIEEQSDRQRRYEAVEKLKDGPLARYLVEFKYEGDGISVENHWFPCLKMHWQPGETLDHYACNMIATNNKAALDRLIESFRQMMLDFQNAGIAHGDLEPKNILVDATGAIKLVDYDAIYTPELKDLQSSETGNPQYQHPSRTTAHFGPWLDNFPALLIDSALTAIAVTGVSSKRLNWENYVQLLKPRSWSQLDTQSPVTRRCRLIKALQMTRLENVPPLNAAIKL